MTFRAFNISMAIFGLILVVLFVIKVVTALNGNDIFR